MDILKDTLSALTKLNNAQAMKKSYQELISLSDLEPLDQPTMLPSVSLEVLLLS